MAKTHCQHSDPPLGTWPISKQYLGPLWVLVMSCAHCGLSAHVPESPFIKGGDPPTFSHFSLLSSATCLLFFSSPSPFLSPHEAALCSLPLSLLPSPFSTGPWSAWHVSVSYPLWGTLAITHQGLSCRFTKLIVHNSQITNKNKTTHLLKTIYLLYLICLQIKSFFLIDIFYP